MQRTAVHLLRRPQLASLAAVTRAAVAASWAASHSSVDLPFSFVPHNNRPAKPRTARLTEVGHAMDGLKFAGSAFSVMSRSAVKGLIDVAHEHCMYVSTGYWVEHVLNQARALWLAATIDAGQRAGRSGDAGQQCLGECRVLGSDTVELSTGFISLPDEDLVRLVKDVTVAGLRPKPEVGIQIGAGGDTQAGELAVEGTLDVSWAIRRARRCLEAGTELLMIESEGINEDVATWRTDVVSHLEDALGLKRPMFETANPPVFSWYVRAFGPRVNLFVDHSQIVQLECLRHGIWGTKSGPR